jgi:predicted 2-oxoglutarate/Fe(II)-dependent dioxygenase YbiX
LTAITYLNDEVPEGEKRGELRLYCRQKIVDVMPRMGRTIIFRSTYLEHEVKPTVGYDRYAITTWLHGPPITVLERQEDPEGSIFVGIPAYRDLLVVDTVKSLME